jgi:aarF domain-containing kinase
MYVYDGLFFRVISIHTKLLIFLGNKVHYAIFESALTGRASLSSSPTESDDDHDVEFRRGSILDLAAQTPEEAHFIRQSVMDRGLTQGIFELLRRLPRRLLMVIKLK